MSSLTWTLNGVDKTDAVRWTEWQLCETAHRGEVGSATIVLDDPLGTYLPPGQKQLTVEDSGASPTRIFTGFVAERTAKRSVMAPGQRQWTVTLEDLNALLDDRILTGDDANRPAETDRARILWLLGSEAMTGPGISSGHIHDAADNVDMDKVDYRGKTAREVLEDCSQKSGSNFFVYDIGAGRKLFYDLGSGSNFEATIAVSDVSTEVDSSTVFAPLGVEYTYDPSRVYSRVRVRYKQGSTTAWNGTTGSNFRVRETFKRYMRVKTEDAAKAQASKWLAHAATETRSLSLSLVLPSAKVNSIRAGQRVQVKLARHGFTGYEWWRVISRTVSGRTDGLYDVRLSFRDTVKPTRFQAGPDVSVDEEFSNATDVSTPDAPGVVIDAGSITVRNNDATVIIDGSSDFFTIVATGLLTLPRATKRGNVYQSVEIVTGLEYDPASLFFVKAPSKDGKGNWSQPLPELTLSASGTILRMISGRCRYAGGVGAAAKTQVQVTMFTSSPPEGTVNVRYYVLQKTSI